MEGGGCGIPTPVAGLVVLVFVCLCGCRTLVAKQKLYFTMLIVNATWSLHVAEKTTVGLVDRDQQVVPSKIQVEQSLLGTGVVQEVWSVGIKFAYVVSSCSGLFLVAGEVARASPAGVVCFKI